MLVSGSGLLKKCRLSTGRSGGAFQIEVRAHNQKKEFGGEGREVGVGFSDEYACTVHIYKICVWWCWCVHCSRT